MEKLLLTPNPRNRPNTREHPALRKLDPRLNWAGIVAALERLKDESWTKFSQGQGDWGRDGRAVFGRKPSPCQRHQTCFG